MRREDLLKLPSMPAAGPSYPAGPYRFVDREFLVITYETDPELIRAGLPEPLEPIDQPVVHYEWIKMPDSSGFGSYTESGLVIPARLHGEEVNFVSQMYLDDDPPIAAGREIWGFPKKYAHPKLEIFKDTLTGTLEYAGQLVAMFNPTQIVIQAFIKELREAYVESYGVLEPAYPDIIAFVGRLALENIADSDAAYHDMLPSRQERRLCHPIARI